MLGKLKKRPHGFTLIELLIVFLIIGIISGITVISFGDFGSSRRVTVFAEDFLSYLKAMQNQAIIESNPVAIEISQNHYKTYRLNDEAMWQPATGPLFRPPPFPSHITCKLKSNIRNIKMHPGIFIDNSGEISPFQLDFGTTNNPQLITILSDFQGGLRIHKPS